MSRFFKKNDVFFILNGNSIDETLMFYWGNAQIDINGESPWCIDLALKKLALGNCIHRVEEK